MAGEAIAVEFVDHCKYVLITEDSPLLTNRTEKDSVAALLLALQIGRDHLSSILLLPGDLRSRRLEHAAKDLGMETAKLRALFTHLEPLKPFI